MFHCDIKFGEYVSFYQYGNFYDVKPLLLEWDGAQSNGYS